MRTKKMLSAVLSFALVLGSLSGGLVQSTTGQAAETKEKLVVYVAAEGENASGTAVTLDKTPVLVEEGATASDAIKEALNKSEYKDNYTISTGQWGDSLDEINDISSFQIDPADPYNWAYWSFWVNGEYSNLGIGSYELQDQDKISLIFTYNNDSNECKTYVDDESLNPDEAEQAALLENAKVQQQILAENIFKEQFNSGKTIPGIEDASGLYSVFSLAQAGYEADAFYDAVYNKISGQLAGIEKYGKIYDETLGIDITKDNIATDKNLGNKALSQYYGKIALCVLALGKDPANVGGVNLYEKLLSRSVYNASSIYSRESMILFAIDAKECELPEGEEYLTRSELVNTLLADVDNQIDTSIEWNSLDSAAMAIQALAPYEYESIDGVEMTDVQKACEKVMAFLANMQNAKGGYDGYGSDNNVWTLAQVMTTIGAFGFEPLQEVGSNYGFIKNGKTVFDAAGEFVKIEDRTVDSSLMNFQPEQLLRGLNACIRVIEGMEKIYKTEEVAYTATEVEKTLLSADMISPIPTQYYTGKACTPTVTVTCDGKVLKSGTDYTVTYVNNDKVGTAYAVVTGIGSYSLSQRVSFKIEQKSTTTVKPNNTNQNNTNNNKTNKEKTTLKKPVIKKVTSPKKKTLKVTFKKVSGAKKYAVQISTNKKFKKGVKKKTVKKTTATFKKLKSKKKYYVRVRAYKGNTKSAYSKVVKSKKVK